MNYTLEEIWPIVSGYDRMSSSVIQKVFHAFLHRPIQIKFCFILFKALDLELSLIHADFIGLKKNVKYEICFNFFPIVDSLQFLKVHF